MPLKCCVVNCSMRGGRDGGIKFFRFPMIPTKRLKYKALAEERQLAWLKAINRKDLKRVSLKHSTVCSKHFLSGKSANLKDKLNVDWVPSVDLGYKAKIVSTERYERGNKRASQKVETDNLQKETFGVVDNQNIIQEKACQTEDFYLTTTKDELIAQLKEQNKVHLQKIKQLKRENLKARINLTLDDLKASPRMTTYYTGFNDFDTLEVIFKNVEHSLPITKGGKMDKFDIFLMVFIKLRLDLPFTHLAFQYHVTTKTISILFHKAIIAIHNKISCFVFWPDIEASKRNIPEMFKQIFGMKPVFIIDCFEIFIEKLGNCLVRVNTFSNYKHHQTLKYLVCISSFGSIAFISKGYGGRCSDKFIFESCGILDYINEEDIIFIDYIIKISCAVINLNPSIVVNE